ncbi:MAG: hypothetical protein KAS23_05690 [Anaerohalosphaera sp.]|nr:hypothetical protein [Anaerohalosphaera sp.]
MEKANIIIGCIIVVFVMTVLTALTFWSRKTIDRIASGPCKTVRQTLKGLNGGR